MGIKMRIHNIKSISDFEFDIPTERGLYALTGENASGKSTVLACAATAFYNPNLYSYFGKPYEGAVIEFEHNGRIRAVTSSNGKWKGANKSLYVSGFFEGSLVFGNRFKDVDFALVQKLAEVSESQLESASTFVKENLGDILHDNKAFYDELYYLKKEERTLLGLRRPTFYFKRNGMLINQLNMSTGENLLLTILHSLEAKIAREEQLALQADSSKERTGITFILLDEIELALHSSALRRLVFFLDQLSKKYNFVVLFSTHSIELIRSISPDNIFYIQRHVDNSIEVITPCYPVYATRNLESSNYGHDFVIMVEDDLAKQIVDRILRNKQLLGNKRVLVISVGGWHQVLRFAYDTIRSNLMLISTKVLIILDRDIEDEVPKFMKKERIGFAVKPHFLPVQSLEKFLLEKLTQKVDHSLFRELNDYVFQGKSLDEIIHDYLGKVRSGEYSNEEEIKNGKTLYKHLKHELSQIRKVENELIQIIVDYLFRNCQTEVEELATFLEQELSSVR